MDAHKEHVEWGEQGDAIVQPCLALQHMFHDQRIAGAGESGDAAVKAVEEAGPDRLPRPFAGWRAPIQVGQDVGRHQLI